MTALFKITTSDSYVMSDGDAWGHFWVLGSFLGGLFFVKPAGMGDNSNKIVINENNSINS